MKPYNKPGKKEKKNRTAQKDLFLKIWNERPHYSELSGKYLGEEPNSWFFAHILSKGAAPNLKYDPRNIMLVTKEEHWELDQNTHKAKENPLYAPYFERAEQLKGERGDKGKYITTIYT